MYVCIHLINSKGKNRFLTVYKREGSTIVQADAIIKLQKSSKQSIYALLNNFPLNHKECQDLLPPMERERPLNADGKKGKIKKLQRLISFY